MEYMVEIRKPSLISLLFFTTYWQRTDNGSLTEQTNLKITRSLPTHPYSTRPAAPPPGLRSE